MTLSLVLLILLKVCSFYWMVVAMPTSCKLQGHLVESVHHRLQDLVRPLTFRENAFVC